MKKPSSVNPATRQRKSHRQDAPAALVRNAQDTANKARAARAEERRAKRDAAGANGKIAAGKTGTVRRTGKAEERNERRRLGSGHVEPLGTAQTDARGGAKKRGANASRDTERDAVRGVRQASARQSSADPRDPTVASDEPIPTEAMLRFPKDPTLEQRIHSWLDVLIHVWRKRSQGKTRFVRNARLSDSEIAQVGAGVQRLSRGFTGHRRLVGSTYLADPELLGAYLLFYWPVSYAQAWTVLSDQERIHGALSLKRIADLGSGPGPVACALMNAAPHDEFNIPDCMVLAMDHVPEALELFRDICATAWGSAFAESPRCTTKVWNAQDELVLPDNLDCITFGHVLNELWADAPSKATGRRVSLIKKAESFLRKPEPTTKKSLPPCVLILEPALKPTTRALLEIRDALNHEGQRILGPCFFRGPCPALATADGTCHGQVFWEVPSLIRRLATVAKVSKDEIAMAWLSVTPGKDLPPESPEDYRVVSEAMVNKAGRTRYMICGSGGRFSFSALLPVDPPRGVLRSFAGLRRGDAVHIREPELREGGWGVAEKTVLKEF